MFINHSCILALFKHSIFLYKGFGPGLELTDEEKKLLDLENMIIPEDCSLTKEEEKALKKVRRKIKNKVLYHI